MGGGKKYLNKKIVCMIKEHLAFAQGAVNKVVSVKSNHITFLVERHDPEVI
jgi:hypothetical protein